MLTRRRFILTSCAACAALANTRIVNATTSEHAPIEEISGPGYKIHFIGGMREVIMSGKRDAVLDLRTLKGKPHLYGLGPIEGLTGEVTIVDSRSMLAHVGTDHQVHVTESYAVGVPFFIWTEVPTWQTFEIPATVVTFSELEKFVGEAAIKVSLGGKAFPFMVTGQPKVIHYHVVDAKPDTPPGMDAHKAIQIPFELQQTQATLIGFWSTQHQGVFTPMGSNMHVHFQANNSASGHVQDVELAQHGMVLHLPKA